MADSKIENLVALTTSKVADVLAIVDDPAGTPITKKITINDLFKMPAGTAALAPMRLTSGTNLTTPAAGAFEYDGKVGYFTPTANARGVIQSRQVAIVDADHSLVSQTAVQAAFPAAYDVWSLDAATTYLVEGILGVNTATNTSMSLAFLAGGGLTITRIHLAVNGWLSAANTTVTASNYTTMTQLAATIVTAAATTAIKNVQFQGHIQVNVGGTLTPQVAFSGAPASPVMRAGSWISFTPMGSNTMTKVGNVA